MPHKFTTLKKHSKIVIIHINFTCRNGTHYETEHGLVTAYYVRFAWANKRELWFVRAHKQGNSVKRRKNSHQQIRIKVSFKLLKYLFI